MINEHTLIDEKAWIDLNHGMNLNPNQKTRDNENGILFLVEYFYLKEMFLNHASPKNIETFKFITERIQTFKNETEQIKGLYDRAHKESLWPKEKIRTISHDNLTAIVSFSYHNNLEFHKDVYNHMWNTGARFDNVYPETPRIERTQHPRDIIYWARLGGPFLVRMLAFMLMPLVYLDAFISCWSAKEDRPQLITRILFYLKTGEKMPIMHSFFPTSGKLLVFVRLFALKKKKDPTAWLTWQICQGIIKCRHGKSINDIFKIYFTNENHPIRQLSESIRF